DVAGGGGRLLVATPDDVLVGEHGEFLPSDFGCAAAVGVAPDGLFAAAPDGQVATLDGDQWRTVATVESPRRFDGNLLAAENGVYRVNAGLDCLGLADVRDVSRNGPFAATSDGLHHRTEDAWVRVYTGSAVSRVAADERHRLLIDEGRLQICGNGGWVEPTTTIEEEVADVACGELPYAVTVGGTLLIRGSAGTTADGKAGWRRSPLGVTGCVALAIA
ncbi:MAG: hypothetical protein ABEH64_05125, partial [Salinirussus sp.]